MRDNFRRSSNVLRSLDVRVLHLDLSGTPSVPDDLPQLAASLTRGGSTWMTLPRSSRESDRGRRRCTESRLALEDVVDGNEAYLIACGAGAALLTCAMIAPPTEDQISVGRAIIHVAQEFQMPPQGAPGANEWNAGGTGGAVCAACACSLKAIFVIAYFRRCPFFGRAFGSKGPSQEQEAGAKHRETP